MLAFDCAVTGLAIAVVRDGVRLASYREEGRDQAARLLPAIAETLREAGVERREVSLLAVTVGPGSFTGVRVGLSAARGLAVGLAIPLAGLPTTAVLLAQGEGRGEGQGRLVVAAIDSRLGDWFCAISEGDSQPFIASTASLAERIAGRPSLIVGAEAEALAASIDGAQALPASPDPTVLAGLAAADGVEGWRTRNREEGLPRPLYLRGVSITLPDGARRTVE